MIMERKIGETFEYEGKTLQVKEIEEHTCKGCFFGDGCDTELHIGVTGECLDRTDGKEVIYVEVPEQPAPQKETKLNLLEILCYCPEGTAFWSPLLGDVRFICVGKTTIPVEDKNGHSWDINPDSTMTIDGITSAEPMLFPSKEQRDWGKVHYQTPLEKLPKSWEEFCDTHNIRDGEAYCDDHCSIRELTAGGTRGKDEDRNLLSNVEECRQHLAHMQLHQLRNCWRDGWKPAKDCKAYGITNLNNEEYMVYPYTSVNTFLSFQDDKRAEKFLECFRELIKTAGDLI